MVCLDPGLDERGRGCKGNEKKFLAEAKKNPLRFDENRITEQWEELYQSLLA